MTFKHWMTQPPVLYRWKVLITGFVALSSVAGLAYQTDYQNNARIRQINDNNTARIHDQDCARAEGRDDVRTVLFRMTHLSDIFGTSDNIVLYETSMKTIIDAVLPPLEVPNCSQVPG